MVRFIWCVLGMHEWKYSGKIPNWKRVCRKCGKEQKASYDMSYGETIWETTLSHGKVEK